MIDPYRRQKLIETIQKANQNKTPKKNPMDLVRLNLKTKLQNEMKTRPAMNLTTQPQNFAPPKGGEEQNFFEKHKTPIIIGAVLLVGGFLYTKTK